MFDKLGMTVSNHYFTHYIFKGDATDFADVQDLKPAVIISGYFDMKVATCSCNMFSLSQTDNYPMTLQMCDLFVSFRSFLLLVESKTELKY